jgi:acyl carrier protein
MTNQLIETRFRELFVRYIGFEPIDVLIRREEIPAWDSLRHAELIIALQREFSFRFSMNELLRSETYQSLLDVVLAKASVVAAKK